jgi:putative transposase
MKRSRFSEEQIIAILKEHEAGVKTVDIRRRYGISDAPFYKWKAKYGGMEVSEAKRLTALEDENARLKKLLAEAMLDSLTQPMIRGIMGPEGGADPKGGVANDLASKKWCRPAPSGKPSPMPGSITG